MTLAHAAAIAEWLFLGYFVCLNAGYLMLYLFALSAVRHRFEAGVLDDLPHAYSGLEPPVSIVVPAYNEEATIATSVSSMLQLDYPEFEVIVVNDGSRDGTMEALRSAFALVPFPEAYWRRLEVKPVRGIYRSTRHPNLRVIDKENGGKADALNAGINASRCPLFCGVDADSILERSSLRRVVAPFLEDPAVVASGGTVRIANGCTVRDGFLEAVALPSRLLPLMQIVEYLRAFLFGRMGWSPLNAVLIISGAFGLFRKETVVAAGGYRERTIGEDMELVVRLHRMHRATGRAYRIVYVPDPICWTEAPESLRVLRSQRSRWQRGLAESLSANLGLLGRHGGAAGWLAFPFMAFFEGAGPLIEVAGYVLMLLGFAAGIVSGAACAAFLLLAIGLGIALSVCALLLEEMSFHIYTRPRELALLALAAVVENFGYRQLVSLWRLEGLLRWMSGARARWGDMTRDAQWQKPA
ncbi:MAG TPA: glycosyltransferase [Burkholderiales bacterium]|jgi:cellulose synthase/poly-beta-1,6-N-acetylglucosamine synthase-like glycosyltransferase|nr:glycosyltransferase [Burkholderiales bacterium]